MAGEVDKDNVVSALIRLNPLSAGKRRKQPATALPAQLKTLREWQVSRLQKTHQDLLNSERFGPACSFFLSDIYAARDFSQRDQDLTQVYHSMGRFLPPRVTEVLRLLFELNVLTSDLDQQLLEVLVEQLHMSDSFTVSEYSQAYRLCDNYEERRRQIALTVAIGTEVDWLVQRPFIGTALRVAYGPARLAGWAELHDFFARGFAAFQKMGDAGPFLALIEQREQQILDRLFAGEADPFAI